MKPRISITEYFSCAISPHGQLMPVPDGEPLAEQSFDLTNESQKCEPFETKTKLIEISATVPYCLGFGENPVADPGFHRRPAGSYFIGAKGKASIAFVLSEDAMEMMSSGMGANVDGLAAAINLISDKSATSKVIQNYQSASAEHTKAATEAKAALEALSAKQDDLTAQKTALDAKATDLTNGQAELTKQRNQLAADIGAFSASRSATQDQLQKDREAFTAEQAAALKKMQDAQTVLDSKNAETAQANNRRTTELEATARALDARQKALQTREDAVSVREATASTRESNLNSTIEKLRSAGIQLTIDQKSAA